MADVTNTFYSGQAFIGYGAQVLVGQGDGSPETFVAIPDVNRIVPGDMTTGVIPKTHLRSPGRHHEKLGTIRDSGAFAVDANYRPAHGAHKQAGGDGFGATRSVLTLWRNVTEANFKIVLPVAADGEVSPAEGIELPFRGLISKYQIGELALEDKCPVMIEITPLEDYSDSLP